MAIPESKPFTLPRMSADFKQALRDYWAFQQAHSKELNELLMVAVMEIPDFVPVIKSMSKEFLEKNQRESEERSRRAFEHDEWLPYFQALRKDGEHYARMGISFSAWIDLLRRFKDLSEPLMAKDLAKDPARLSKAISAMNELLYISIEVIGEAYLVTKEQVIRQQEESIRELSTPVLKVRDRVLILPIIGIVDTLRARQVTESMLRAIRSERAKAVVMDITGVPMVDSKVANHLVQSVEAARLMGATVIVTGLSPEIAQTLVALGAELPNVRTFGDLQGGMEEAENLAGLEVRRKPKAAAAGA
jgi:anti-anti-sigma regulatory factor